MADALDSGSSGSLSCVGSSPILRIKKARNLEKSKISGFVVLEKISKIMHHKYAKANYS